MIEIRRLIFFLFVVNGAGYLLFVDQHYNDSGWYVWIKYILLSFLIVLSTVSSLIARNFVLNKKIVIIFFLWCSACLAPIIFGADAFRSALYLIPVFSIFIFCDWRQCINYKYWWLIFWLVFLGSVYEYFWLGGFERFHPTGYRGVSIFVNPNNFGISIVILSAVAVLNSYGNRFLVLIFALLFVLYSGSKTALIMWIFLFLCTIENKLLTKYLALFFIIFLVITIFVLGVQGGFDVSYYYEFTSLLIRFSYALEFFSEVENWILPAADASHYYVDNAYLQLWIDLGFISSVMVFLSIVFLVIFASGYRLLFFLFLLASLTTNIFYIAPVSYFFWLTVGEFIRCATVKKIGVKRAQNENKIA